MSVIEEPEIEEGDWRAAAEEEARLLWSAERERERNESELAQSMRRLRNWKPDQPAPRRVQRPVVRRSSAPAQYPPHEWVNWYSSPSMKERCRVCGRVPNSPLHI